jgi:hypothetical protein
MLRRTSVPLLCCPVPKLLSERVRRLLYLLKTDDELLMPWRRDPEPILAERPHLHISPGCLDPQEGRGCAALPGFGLTLGHDESSLSRWAPSAFEDTTHSHQTGVESACWKCTRVGRLADRRARSRERQSPREANRLGGSDGSASSHALVWRAQSSG